MERVVEAIMSFGKWLTILILGQLALQPIPVRAQPTRAQIITSVMRRRIGRR